MRSRQYDPKCKIKSSQYTLIIPHRVIQLTAISFWVPKTRLPPTNQQTPSSIFIFISSSATGELCSQPVRGNVRQIGRMFPEHVERNFLDPEYSFVAVRRLLRTMFAKQKFAHLRTNYTSPNTPNYYREQRFAQLRTGSDLTHVRNSYTH